MTISLNKLENAYIFRCVDVLSDATDKPNLVGRGALGSSPDRNIAPDIIGVEDIVIAE